MTMTEILAATLLVSAISLMVWDHNRTVLERGRETVKYIQEQREIHDGRLEEAVKMLSSVN